MSKLFIFMILITLFLAITGCSIKDTVNPTDHSYAVWEEASMAHNEEYVVWRRIAILTSDATYAVWEENELSRKNFFPVLENLDSSS